MGYLHSDIIKVNNNYPQYMIKSYQLLKKLNRFKPRHNQIHKADRVVLQNIINIAVKPKRRI